VQARDDPEAGTIVASDRHALDRHAGGRNMQRPIQEEVLGMCYERYLRRRRHEDEESRAIWQEFERTTPIADTQPEKVPEPELAEPEPAATGADR
jgi:hypothetical protein